MNGLDLFSGIGGLTLALAPWVRPVAYCEIDPFARGVLLSRQAAGQLPQAPIWDDVKTLTANLLKPIDIIYGGFPCQPFSTAARGRNNAVDLWPEMLRIVRDCKPRIVFGENVVRGPISKAASDLAEEGYLVTCIGTGTGELRAPHHRKRFWFLAHTHRESEPRCTLDDEVACTSSVESPTQWQTSGAEFVGMDDGVSNRMDRLRALGNAVVPAQARRAFEILSGLRPVP